jgi:NADPH:quinone reductase-like Zn-dependent oxidoreductase
VLVQGSGGVSLFALQFAKAMGAVVIATSSSDEKLARMRAMGADHGINYRSTPNWGEAAFKLTGGVDHVLDVGGSGTLQQSLEAVGYGGHIAVIGILTGRKPGELSSSAILRRRVRIEGVQVGSRADHLVMIAGIESTGIKPVIDRSFAMEELAEGLRFLESGRHFGKLGIEIA